MTPQLSNPKLNGWRRLWIVATVLALLYAVAWAFGNVPSTIRVEDAVLSGYGNPQCRHVVQMPATSTLNPEPAYGDPCWSLYIYRRIYNSTAITGDGYVSDVEGRRRQALLISLGVALGMWLAGASLVYAVGAVVAWVRKGFVQSSDTQ